MKTKLLALILALFVCKVPLWAQVQSSPQVGLLVAATERILPPHPSPLPKGEGEASSGFSEFGSVAQPTVPAVTALPPGSVVAGLTLEEWSAEWWKWQLGLHTSVNPILDTNGMCAHEGQAGPVFYIGGGVTTSGTSNYFTRRVTISSDLYVLFPCINYSGENIGRAVPLSAQELRDEVVILVSLTLEARADVDGVEIPADRILRLLAPVFSYTVPDGDNIFRYFGLDTPGQIVDPAVSDGYWVMLPPLSPGTHVVHFRGVAGPSPFNVGHDATYYLTVVERTRSYEVGVLLTLVQCVKLPPKQEKPLLQLLRASQAEFDRRHWREGIHKLSDFQKKVRAQFDKSNPSLAGEWVRAAQAIIDRATAELGRHTKDTDDEKIEKEESP